MGNEWKTAKLTEHYEIRSGLSKPAKDFGSGYPFLTFKDVFYNYFTPETLGDLVESTEKDRLGCSVRRGDVFLTRTSETMNELGMSCVALKDYENSTFNGFCKRLRPKADSELVPEYVGYYLRSPLFRRLMMAFSTMSTRASLNNEMISRLVISYPAPNEQVEIARVLKVLDEKISLNRQINQTLEQMAQTLFKSWFVDFDPVIDNALDAGNPIPEVFETRVERRKAVRESADFKPLPDDVRKLFPSEFEDSEQGWVPKGWRSVDLTKMVDSISVTYPLKEVDKVIFLNTGDIENGKFLVNEYSDSKGLPGQAKKSIQENDILFSEIRPKNKRFAFVNFDASDYVVSTKLMVLRAKNGFEPLLPYFLVTHDRTTTELQRVAELRSGTFPQITYKELEFISFLLPPYGGLLDFFVSKHLKPIYERSFSFSEENQTLEKLRDTLLPKLISGELRLDSPEVEQAKALVE
ncbi:restriction endonuclease subunit S [Vibrio neptunius]|uniref:Restriction endonuclease subunit S n=1 Tax=Vibrio neptunius TaxID=170651 RepID=A0ABS3A6U6_9VIBR|nr:restriction endonuclease subunit S [Vibrio neptunius]MBN3494161.1 restriction endonuclease subunit S [Vibrio neptunius]MBN3516843.1 restriction endonuclease subunit S [Vibrio neptunius]MBN3550832.1 restriction endonuclease subunit S [Vibrio neptunius]MBN3578963.1 restriction endonuclease subunit S [Vibrio neptunius]MCH9872628.1 restriction endonuclease subunit S [Vibrio neptunius]